MSRHRHIFTLVACTLALAQVLLVPVSWLISTATPSADVRSLLSSEGIRWFIGSFTGNVCNPLLLWVVLLGMALGVLRGCGIIGCRTRSLRTRYALWMAGLTLVAIVVVVVLLTCLPHAILLNSTGHLWPGIFSRSLVPMVALTVMAVTVVFGVCNGNLRSPGDVCRALTGSPLLGSLLLLYLLGAQLYISLVYVFPLPWW